MFRFGRRRNRDVLPDNNRVPLSMLPDGKSGLVLQVAGGRGIVGRLEALGIRPGQRITKISSMFMRGPITIQVGTSQIAIGFGMANKILIKPD